MYPFSTLLLLFSFLLPEYSMAVKPLEGVFPTVLSPLVSDGKIDVDSFRKEIRFVMREGATGIKVLGSVGEGHYIDDDNREILIREARATLGNKGVLIVGVTEISLPKALRQAREAERLGADYLSVQIPTFYSIRPDDVVKHVKSVASAIKTPIIYYHYPNLTNLALSDEKLVEILLLDGVVGAKLTSLQFNQVRNIIKQVHLYKSEAAFLTGSSFNLLWILQNGGAGVIDPVSLFETKVASTIYKLFRDAEYSDPKTASKLIKKAEQLQDYLYAYLPLFQENWVDIDVLKVFFKTAINFGFSIPLGDNGFIARQKQMLNKKGVSIPVAVTEPLTQLTQVDVEIVNKIDEYLKTCDITQIQSSESQAPLFPEECGL